MRVTIWNLGYAGLGAASDFVVDGGAHWFPPSRRAVKNNRDAVADWLAQEGSDVLLLQEIAQPGAANWWVDLKGAVDRSLDGSNSVYSRDISSRWLPFPLRLEHGNATYAYAPLLDAEEWDLPRDGDVSSGMLIKRYTALVTRISAGASGQTWTVVNIHLAAFDEGADLRRRQIRRLMDFAQAEHQRSRLVVIGGDWNLRLAQTDFAHTTEPKHLRWLADLDPAQVPAGWRVVADPLTPSVRTNEKPYVAGENYTAVIDGFVVSPNVQVLSVRGVDLGFRHSDHQPVRAEFGVTA